MRDGCAHTSHFILISTLQLNLVGASGVIAAVQGRALGNDQFQVLDVCFAGLPEQPERPLKSKSSEEGQWIALVSGLELGGREDADDVRVDLLAEWLTGELGSQEVRSFFCHI